MISFKLGLFNIDGDIEYCLLCKLFSNKLFPAELVDSSSLIEFKSESLEEDGHTRINGIKSRIKKPGPLWKCIRNIYLRSGLIDKVSPSPGEIKCDWKNKLSLWNELFTLGAEPLRWLNGSVTLNKFEWLVGLKLFRELPGMFTGAEVPCKRPVWCNKWIDK